EIVSLYLVPADGGALAAFQPGQYIGLRLLLDGGEQRRNYSLSALSNGREYRISVKREVGGKVSNYLHDQLQVGDSLELFAPAGSFVLRESAKPLVLITAGVGITPALSMLEAARDTGRDIHFIHCARHAGVHAFRDWVEAQRAERPQLRHYVCYSEPRAGDQGDAEGLLSLEQLEQWLPEQRDLDAYFLGPKPFMAKVKRHLHSLGVPAAQSHYEFFGPASALDS
ncbi:MAG: nitric oxide dioxygenase, partial [Gammaproteobacteria bacterium]|nr:nitric oxide dioxygenase [Gammaproteobacteria bacterium]